MADNTETILSDILTELKLLTSHVKAEALIRFKTEFLTTSQREKIYNSFDGNSDAKEISEKMVCSDRLVQLFIKELIDNDLVDFDKRGRSIIPIKSLEKIALYYEKVKLKTISEE